MWRHLLRSISLVAVGGLNFTLAAELTRNGVGIPGVTMTFVVNGKPGKQWTYSATTNAQGMAIVQGMLPLQAARGTYRVTVSASVAGVAATAAGSFLY